MSTMSQYPSLSELGLRLTAIDIHQKDFKSSFRGYDPDEVNEYLDEIIRDYQVIEDIVQKMELEIRQLKKKLAETKAAEQPVELPFSRSADRIMEKPTLDLPNFLAPAKNEESERPASRMELIDRVRELEKFCFGRARD